MRALARWNPARDAWEVETTGLFCEHSDVYSETWPSSGTTRAGTAYAPQTSAPPTDDSVSSSSPGLLPTPVADNSRGLAQPGTAYASLPNSVLSLLPTPRATDGTKGGPNQRGSSGDLMLPSAVHALTATSPPTGTTTTDGAPDANVVALLLPTPSVADSEGGRATRSGDRSEELLLNGLAKQWGGASTNPPSADGNG